MIDDLKEQGYSVERSLGLGWIITRKDGRKNMMVRDELFMAIGVPRWNYHHKDNCSYHNDNWTQDSWRLPKPPYCDCHKEELPPMTGDDLMGIIKQGLSLR